MTQSKQPSNPELAALFRAVVIRAIEVYDGLVKEKKHLSSLSNYPTISYGENGLPTFRRSPFDNTVKHYSRVFLDAGLKWEETIELKRLSEYAASNPRMVKYFTIDPERGMDEFDIEYLALQIADRFLHRSPTKQFDEDIFLEAYLPVEKGIFDEVLFIFVVVPILATRFDFDLFEVSETVTVFRMSEHFQKSRAYYLPQYGEISENVAGAATHALVLSGWHIKNEHYFETLLTGVSDQLVEQVDNFVGAMRVVQSIEVGYSQILYAPIDWALTYHADLSPMIANTRRAYPRHFNDGVWNKTEIPTLSPEDMREIAHVFNRITEIGRNELSIGVKRLNRCVLREDEEDSILDAAIGLEALLLSDSMDELVYKLSLRLAALTRLSKQNYSSVEVFKRLKAIYAYRSSVIHGGIHAAKKREITVEPNKKIPAVTAAIEYLRLAIRILAEYSKYLDPTKIDEELLLGAISAGDRHESDTGSDSSQR